MLKVKLYRLAYAIEYATPSTVFLPPILFGLILSLLHISSYSDISLLVYIVFSLLFSIMWYLPMLAAWMSILLVASFLGYPMIQTHSPSRKYRYRGRTIIITDRYAPLLYTIKYTRSGVKESDIRHEDLKPWTPIIFTRLP